MKLKDYLKTDGDACPFCGIEGGWMDIDEDPMYDGKWHTKRFRARCDACEAEWIEVFRLVKIERKPTLGKD